MISDELKGKEVVGKNGFKIGKAKDVVFNNSDWKITHLDVVLNSNIESELGMSGNMIFSHNHLPLEVSNVEGIGDVITLRTTKEELLDNLKQYNKTIMPT